jgi:hypothetical protein
LCDKKENNTITQTDSKISENAKLSIPELFYNYHSKAKRWEQAKWREFVDFAWRVADFENIVAYHENDLNIPKFI